MVMAFEPKFVPQGDVKGKDSCAHTIAGLGERQQA